MKHGTTLKHEMGGRMPHSEITQLARKRTKSSVNVMAIDDDAFDLKACKRVVQRSDAFERSMFFHDAQLGLLYLQNASNPVVDLILLDVNMPQMDGFEFLDAAYETLGNQFTSKIVFMLSAPLTSRDHARAIAYPNVRGFLNKPMKTHHPYHFICVVNGKGKGCLVCIICLNN